MYLYRFCFDVIHLNKIIVKSLVDLKILVKITNIWKISNCFLNHQNLTLHYIFIYFIQTIIMLYSK